MSVSDTQSKYKLKLKQLKRLIRQVVFENAALCDECVSVSHKLDKVKEERKFLLKRLLHCQTDRPHEPQLGGHLASSSPRLPHSQQSLRAILSKLTAQEGAAVVKAMDSNRKKQIAKLREKVKKKYAKKKTVKEVLEEQRQSDRRMSSHSDSNREPSFERSDDSAAVREKDGGCVAAMTIPGTGGMDCVDTSTTS